MNFLNVRSSILPVAAIIFLSGCGVKTYKPDPSLQPSSWLQIDGSKSRRGIRLLGFGTKYQTFVHIWRYYPDTCEAYYRGAIKVNKNHSSEKLPIPADVPTYIQATRESSGTDFLGQYHNTDGIELYLVPKPGHGYVFTVRDKDRDFFDIDIAEVTKSGTAPLQNDTADNFRCDKDFRKIKKLRSPR